MKKIFNKKFILISIIILLVIIFSFILLLFTNKGTLINGNIFQNIYNDDTNTEENKDGKTSIDLDSADLFSDFYDKAETLLDSMTIEEKVGQMFLVRYKDEGVIEEIVNEKPGGYILFKKDFQNHTKNSILNELENNQKNSKINLFLAVDEEGGTVVRVSAIRAFRDSPFKSAQELATLDNIISDSHEKSALLKSVGLNMNLCPVADIPTRTDSFIYKRSYGKDATSTAEYVSSLIKTMNEDNMISSIKHFPGYGDNVDTHTGIAVDTRDMETFKNADFLPFIAGINSDAPTILVNHNIINCMDRTKPASLSENVHKILREDLNFSGLIITDDLAMDAVKTYAENRNAAVQAVLAGNDVIISSDFKNQKQEIIDAIKNGVISEETINLAVRRILACKYKYQIIK